MLKVTVQRQTMRDETVMVEITLPATKTPESLQAQWATHVAPALLELDRRMSQHGAKYVLAVDIVNQFPPEYRAAVKTMVDGLLWGTELTRLEAVPGMIPKNGPPPPVPTTVDG